MSTTDRVRELVEPLVSDLGAVVYDVEQSGGVLRVSLDRPGGIDMAAITEATRRISAELDAADLVQGSYTLEVSSPGLERPLRTPAHFAGAVGERVKIKTRPGVDGDRRVDGELVDAEGDRVTVRSADGTERELSLADIDRAHTHVEWTPPPKPGGSARPPAGGRPASGDTPPTPQSSTPPSTTQSEATS